MPRWAFSDALAKAPALAERGYGREMPDHSFRFSPVPSLAAQS